MHMSDTKTCVVIGMSTDISKKNYNLLKSLLPKISYDFEFDMCKDALKMIDDIIEVRNENIEQLKNHPLPEPMKLNLELLSTEQPLTEFDKYINIRKSNLKALKNYTIKYNNTNNINEKNRYYEIMQFLTKLLETQKNYYYGSLISLC